MIADADPVFTRLEHYKLHEYSRNNNTRKVPPPAISLSMPEVKRRRGRPPKYPKSEIPVVPKIEMSEEEIRQEIAKQGLNTPIASGFRKFSTMQPCPDDKCMYFLREHYHCVRQRCHHATDRPDVLNLHAKDFHSFITILEGFAFFDRNVNCRRPHCHNNKANRHYHCVRPRCDYSFVRYSTMAQHDKKHKLQELTKLQQNASVPISLLNQVPVLNPGQVMLTPKSGVVNPQSVVKAAGTFFPITTPGGPVMLSFPSVASTLTTNTTASTSSTTPIFVPNSPPIVIQPEGKLKNIAPKPVTVATATPSAPLATLLQQKGANMLPTPSWNKLLVKMFCSGNENCGRPFCKLKKKDHYHCFECNQAFSDTLRLRGHVMKHGVKLDSHEMPVLSVPQVPQPQPADLSMKSNREDGNKSTQPVEVELSDEEEDTLINPSSSLNLSAENFSRILDQGKPMQVEDANDVSDVDEDSNGLVMDLSAGISESKEEEKEDKKEEEENEEDLSALRRSGRKRSATKHDDFVDSDVAVVAGKLRRRSCSPRASTLRDDNVPQGFDKYRFDTDCNFQRCAYRLNNTHYHCVREECGFALGDRSRAPGHLEKHRKTDALVMDEFQQFTLHSDCKRESCDMNKKATHFHCLKCEFLCSESSKVHSHRRFHHNQLKEKSKMAASAADQSETPKQELKMVVSEVDLSEHEKYEAINMSTVNEDHVENV